MTNAVKVKTAKTRTAKARTPKAKTFFQIFISLWP